MDILFTPDSDKKVTELSDKTIKDLAITELSERICSIKEERDIVMKVLSKIPHNISDIEYRRSILSDLLENAKLCEDLSECIGDIFVLKNYSGTYKNLRKQDATLFSLLEDLRELEVYAKTTEKLAECLGSHELRSEGFKAFRDEQIKIVSSPDFKVLKDDLELIIKDLSVVRGCIVGVNFTPDLNIKEVAAMEFVPYHFRPKYSLAEKLTTTTLFTPESAGFRKSHALVADPLLAQMAPKLEKHLKHNYSDIKKIFHKYADFDSKSITESYEGLTYYLAMARFGRRLRSDNFEICFPTSSDNRDFSIKDLYNLRLAVAGEKDIVKNDFEFSSNERIFILTGPNRGGKTILEQGLGIAILFASIGAFVTASSCSGMSFTNILTHFPIDENLTINYGRLGEEAIRVKSIVNESDDRTLILFNETYSTTSMADGLYLSRDLIRILKEKGSYVIFNTHIHDLARETSEMDKWDGESNIISIVMERVNGQNTFKVKRDAPDTSSHAKAIAEKYGITYEQMSTKKVSPD